MGENNLFNHFYNSANTPGNGTMTPTRDTTGKFLLMSFNKTTCLDGRLRDGSVFMLYRYDTILFPNKEQTRNSKYMREKGFAGNITLSDYRVDNWLIQTDRGIPAKMFNKLETEKYDPTVTKLTWYFGGRFIFTSPADTNKKMVCEVRLTKTLENSTDPKVFAPTKSSAITWSLGTISYQGDANGSTIDGVAYTFSISPSTPVKRDFTCYSDPILTVATTATVGVVNSVKQEYHPFISGIMSLKEGTKYVRQVYYGNEDDATLNYQCDNKGVVLIQGNSYPVDFRR